jgi:hypothetical protein
MAIFFHHHHQQQPVQPVQPVTHYFYRDSTPIHAHTMILLDWFWSLLYQLGFFSKKATVLLLGLDNAGKTTLMYDNRHHAADAIDWCCYLLTICWYAHVHARYSNVVDA